ncbi:MAG TPA: DUF3489 domain-containing protein [Bryobacteraceae bacterium]|nr:DUF3489 domain-containing protein [Bryobacteraceae bacterium]
MKKSKSAEQANTAAAAAPAQQPEAPKPATAAPQGAEVAPAKASSKKGASPKKDAPKAKKGAKKAATQKQAKETGKKATKPQDAPAPREQSKKDIILDLLRRPKGATLAELMAASGWQAHSIRGFISGTLGKKLDLPVVSAKREDGARVYSLAK